MELKVTIQEKALADAILQKSIPLQPPPEISINFTGIDFKKSLDAPDISRFRDNSDGRYSGKARSRSNSLVDIE
jgi:hypothetical protein